MLNNVMKKGLLILTIAMIVLIVAQMAMLFVPYFELTPQPTRKEPNPVSTKYSIQNLVWTDTETMVKVIMDKDVDDEVERVNEMVKNGTIRENLAELEQTYPEHVIERLLDGKKIKQKDVETVVKEGLNDDLVDLALVNAFSIIGIIMMLMELKHQFSKYRLASRSAWIVLSHFFSLVWGLFGVLVFTTNCPTLDLGYNQVIVTVCMVIGIVGLALEVIRLALAVLTRTRYKKVKAVF